MIVAFCAWLLLLFTAGLRRDPERGRQDALTFLFFLAFSTLGIGLQELVIRFRPTTYDPQFLMADRALRLDPLAVMAWIGAHPHFGNFFGLVYVSLPVVMVLTWMIEQNRTLRRAQLIGGYLCFVFYVLLPAVGPGVYDWRANAAAHGQMMLWRNCMPSMHFAWILLMARNTQNKVLAGFLWVFAALTAASTIVVGQHYFIDLIAVVPYVILVQWLAENVHIGRSEQVPEIGALNAMRLRRTPYTYNVNFQLAGTANRKGSADPGHSQ